MSVCRRETIPFVEVRAAGSPERPPFRNTSRLLGLVPALWLLAGCATQLPPPLPRSPIPPLPQIAWIKSVRIADPVVRGRPELEDAMVIQLSDQLRKAGYFSDVRTLPGVPGPNDLLLEFLFTGYHGSRRIHPAYFPGAFLTLTMWIWFGGPIMKEDVQYSGTLTVERADGTAILETHGERSRQQTLNFYSDNYFNPDTKPDRDAAIAEMLDTAVRQLARGKAP